MYTANQSAYPGQMPAYVQPQQQHRSTKSAALIIFGGINIGISSLMLIFCFWAAATTYANITGYVGIFSAIFHIILGVIGVIGGNDTKRRRSFVITCLVMGIIGACIFVVSTMTTASFEWSAQISCTWTCDYSQGGQSCTTTCNDSPIFLNVVILVLSIIEGIIDIVLSSLTCHNMCRCCNQETSGYVRQPTEFVHNAMRNHQIPAAYHAPQYPNQMPQHRNQMPQHPNQMPQHPNQMPQHPNQMPQHPNQKRDVPN